MRAMHRSKRPKFARRQSAVAAAVAALVAFRCGLLCSGGCLKWGRYVGGSPRDWQYCWGYRGFTVGGSHNELKEHSVQDVIDTTCLGVSLSRAGPTEHFGVQRIINGLR